MTNNNPTDSDVGEQISSRIPILIATRGPLTDSTFCLNERIVFIGRGSSNDIVVKDSLVSRHHCVIRNGGGQYTIEDLDSSNGTYVDGERVQTGPLKEGSLIEIGVSRFLFRLRNDEEIVASRHNVIEAENTLNCYKGIRVQLRRVKDLQFPVFAFKFSLIRDPCERSS
jgi:pSer/pThr/pTyr-binding forkhead associated (FHA) protein